MMITFLHIVVINTDMVPLLLSGNFDDILGVWLENMCLLKMYQAV